MKGVPAIYRGKIVNKENFRVFVYGANDAKKLVESWDEFENEMQSGLWFATKEEAKASVVEKAKRVRKAVTVKTVALKEDIEKDDFLPKAGD